MATDFAPGGAKKIPCAKEAMHYTVTPKGGKAVNALRLTSRIGSETETFSKWKNRCIRPVAQIRAQNPKTRFKLWMWRCSRGNEPSRQASRSGET